MFDLTSNDRSGAFSRFRVWGVACLLALALVGCATAPPGAHYPKIHSVALTDFASTRLGRQFDRDSHANGGRTAFRLINVGVDGFLMRLEMINAAERTLDLQYFIFRGDDDPAACSAEALLRAADRGVRVRVLVDDGDTAPGDEQVTRAERDTAPWKSVFSIRSPTGDTIRLIRGTGIPAATFATRLPDAQQDARRRRRRRAGRRTQRGRPVLPDRSRVAVRG